MFANNNMLDNAMVSSGGGGGSGEAEEDEENLNKLEKVNFDYKCEVENCTK